VLICGDLQDETPLSQTHVTIWKQLAGAGGVTHLNNAAPGCHRPCFFQFYILNILPAAIPATPLVNFLQRTPEKRITNVNLCHKALMFNVFHDVNSCPKDDITCPPT
jgi:hypothetical protein